VGFSEGAFFPTPYPQTIKKNFEKIQIFSKLPADLIDFLKISGVGWRLPH